MWGQRYGKAGDVEDGGAAQPLYPMMLEPPELRWAFIRKVYSIVTVQLLLTVAVAAVVVNVHPVALFFVSSTAGIVVYIHIAVTPIILVCLLYFFSQRHPVNYLLLGAYTVSLSFAIGLACAFTSGVVVLEAAILTSAVVVSLTLYTFWAARRGHDFGFLGPLLFSAILVLVLFALIQIFFPMGKTWTMVYGALSAIIFCGFIIIDTDNLIKRYSYDEFIWASIQLYLDILNLFITLLRVFRVANN